MSVESDMEAIDRRVDTLFNAIGGNVTPQISSYPGSPTFQSMVETEKTNKLNDGAIGPSATPAPATDAPAAAPLDAGSEPLSSSHAILPLTSVPVDIDRMIGTAAINFGVEPALIKAVAKNESGFNPRAESPVGAKGEMQLMDATAAGLGVTNSFDPEQNIEGGARYLRGLMDRFHGNLSMAIAAYNAGPGAVEKYGGIPPYAETKNYVNNVMASYEQYRSQAAMQSSIKANAQQ